MRPQQREAARVGYPAPTLPEAPLLPVLFSLFACPYVGPDAWDRVRDIDADDVLDGRFDGPDCDDGDPTVGRCDADGDGHRRPPWGDDCDDDDPLVHPDRPELCNGIDDDCDGRVDDEGGAEVAPGEQSPFYVDGDGDGFGDAEREVFACFISDGLAAMAGDCDDADADVHPDATERCDAVDRDCDGDPTAGAIDVEPWSVDADGDGWGRLNDPAPVLACVGPPGTGPAGDCNDEDPSVSPSAIEVCNGVDDDCDGLVDDADFVANPLLWSLDLDSDGYGRIGSEVAQCLNPSTAVATYVIGAGVDCDDDDPLVATTLNWYADCDGDGFGDGPAVTQCGAPAPQDGCSFVRTPGDCDDGRPDVNPAAVEVCNGVDDDCNGQVDGEDAQAQQQTFYLDFDGDGVGTSAVSVRACAPPEGYVAEGGDCDDLDDAVYRSTATLPVAGESAQQVLETLCDDAYLFLDPSFTHALEDIRVARPVIVLSSVPGTLAAIEPAHPTASLFRVEAGATLTLADVRLQTPPNTLHTPALGTWILVSGAAQLDWLDSTVQGVDLEGAIVAGAAFAAVTLDGVDFDGVTFAGTPLVWMPERGELDIVGGSWHHVQPSTGSAATAVVGVRRATLTVDGLQVADTMNHPGSAAFALGESGGWFGGGSSLPVATFRDVRADRTGTLIASDRMGFSAERLRLVNVGQGRPMARMRRAEARIEASELFASHGIELLDTQASLEFVANAVVEGIGPVFGGGGSTTLDLPCDPGSSPSTYGVVAERNVFATPGPIVEGNGRVELFLDNWVRQGTPDVKHRPGLPLFPCDPTNTQFGPVSDLALAAYDPVEPRRSHGYPILDFGSAAEPTSSVMWDPATQSYRFGPPSSTSADLTWLEDTDVDGLADGWERFHFGALDVCDGSTDYAAGVWPEECPP